MRPDAQLLRSGLLSLATTANGLRPLERHGYASVPAFALGWPVSELPRAVGVLDAAVAARHLARGGARTPLGRLGLAAHLASWAGLVVLDRAAARADDVLEAALVEALGSYRVAHPRGEVPASLGVLRTFRARKTFVAHGPLSYGAGRNGVDIWKRPDVGPRAPVLLQVPGGGWMMGKRGEQAFPLLRLMAELGWVCVAIDYSLSPRSKWPAHVVDVKRAIAWTRESIAEHGGDPSFIAVTGGSAGGHLASLAALTPGDFQPGFGAADTSVQAAVPFYGAYDLTDDDGVLGHLIRPHLERIVMPTRLRDSPEDWRAASPSHRVHSGAPPFFVLHGTNDTLLTIEQADGFVQRLRAVSAAPVAYARLPRAQHAFDLTGSVRGEAAARAAARFLGHVWSTRSVIPPGHS